MRLPRNGRLRVPFVCPAAADAGCAASVTATFRHRVRTGRWRSGYAGNVRRIDVAGGARVVLAFRVARRLIARARRGHLRLAIARPRVDRPRVRRVALRLPRTR